MIIFTLNNLQLMFEILSFTFLTRDEFLFKNEFWSINQLIFLMKFVGDHLIKNIKKDILNMNCKYSHLKKIIHIY